MCLLEYEDNRVEEEVLCLAASDRFSIVRNTFLAKHFKLTLLPSALNNNIDDSKGLSDQINQLSDDASNGNNVNDQVLNLLDTVGDTVGSLTDTVSRITGGLTRVLTRVPSFLTNTLTTTVDTLASTVGSLTQVISSLQLNLAQLTSSVADNGGDMNLVGSIMSAVDGLTDNLGTAIDSTVDGITELVKKSQYLWFSFKILSFFFPQLI